VSPLPLVAFALADIDEGDAEDLVELLEMAEG